MTKKTASKKKATQEPETDAKVADQSAAEIKKDQKPEAEAADKAEAKPKAKRRGRPSKKKPASKVKASDKPTTEEEQTSEDSGKGKEQEAPRASEAMKTEAKKQEDAPKPEPVQQKGDQQQNQEAQTPEAPRAAENEVSKPKPKAKRGAKKPKARGGKKAAKAPEKSENADKGVIEEIRPAARQGKRVVVASRNPAKIKAAELGFSRMFPDQEFVFDGIAVSSGVADQPMTDDETFMGALHRALTAQQEEPEADYWIGLEGGLQEEGDDFYGFAWIMVIGPKGMQGKSRTGTFVLPLEVAELVRDGKELGEADDIIFGKTNSKHSSGAIGILTHGLIDRAEYYAGAVSMALIPFKNPELYAVEDTLIEVQA